MFREISIGSFVIRMEASSLSPEGVSLTCKIPLNVKGELPEEFSKFDSKHYLFEEPLSSTWGTKMGMYNGIEKWFSEDSIEISCKKAEEYVEKQLDILRTAYKEMKKETLRKYVDKYFEKRGWEREPHKKTS